MDPSTWVIYTFLIVVAIIFGAYWILVVAPEGREHAALRKRLRPGRRTKALAQERLLKEPSRPGDITLIETALRRTGGLVTPLETLIDQAGVRTSVSVVLVACACIGLGTGIVVSLGAQRWWFGIPAGAVTMLVPIFFLRYRRDRRVLQFEEQFPEAIDLIARALRAGHAFTTGLSMVADEVDAPVGHEFRLLYERQNFGMPLPEALREFAQRIPVLDAKFFATAVLTQRESGGNLAEVLDNLSSVIRERFRVKRQVRVISAHGRVTGWVLSLLPPCLALAFVIVSPGHLDRLLSDPLGEQMVAGALTLQLIGTMFIRRIVRIEY